MKKSQETMMLYKEADLLHNDLTDEEYDMLERIYNKGVSIYDSKK